MFHLSTLAFIVFIFTALRIVSYGPGELTASEAEALLFPDGNPHAVDFTVLRRDAEAGDAAAQWRMGQEYFSGRLLSLNVVKAYKWFALAARQRETDGDLSVALRALEARMNDGQIEKGRQAAEAWLAARAAKPSAD